MMGIWDILFSFFDGDRLSDHEEKKDLDEGQHKHEVDEVDSEQAQYENPEAGQEGPSVDGSGDISFPTDPADGHEFGSSIGGEGDGGAIMGTPHHEVPHFEGGEEAGFREESEQISMDEYQGDSVSLYDDNLHAKFDGDLSHGASYEEGAVGHHQMGEEHHVVGAEAGHFVPHDQAGDEVTAAVEWEDSTGDGDPHHIIGSDGSGGAELGLDLEWEEQNAEMQERREWGWDDYALDWVKGKGKEMVDDAFGFDSDDDRSFGAKASDSVFDKADEFASDLADRFTSGDSGEDDWDD